MYTLPTLRVGRDFSRNIAGLLEVVPKYDRGVF